MMEMAAPDGPNAFRRFLIMVTYLSKFIPSLSDLSAPLRESIRVDVPWSWCDKQQEAFNHIKVIITTAPSLKFYDVHKQVTLTCDASSHGLEAACLQDGNPVAYASRALTATQEQYAQIEKELLAVVFACNKFHDYAYGQKVTVETDHYPQRLFLRDPYQLYSSVCRR